MKRKMVFVLFSLFLSTTVWCQYPDSILIAEKSNYLSGLLSRRGSIHYITGSAHKLVRPKDKFHIEKPQLLIKTDSALFLGFSGSGRIYKLIGEDDSCYVFSRQDLTENINYNLGAHYFSYKSQLYSFGGYGFWKTNGNLKFFNTKDQQWDIIPLSEEIIPQFHPIEANWFSSVSGKFFVPLQSVVNAGIIGTENVKGKLIPYSYELNINTQQWKKLGKTNPLIIEIITNGQTSFRSQRGIIILYYDKVYLVDFIKNRLYISNESLFNQSLSRKGNVNFVYESNGFIYSYNNSNKTTDSLRIDDTFFEDTGMHIWDPTNNYSLILIGLLTIIIFSGTLYYIIARKKRSVTEINVKEKNYHIRFSDIEIALINLLIEKSKLNQKATINEVNYVLGLKYKNTGLQKKVRSDTFNSINDKFRYISNSDELLIQSIRSEIDKRFFEYFISSNHINLITDHL